MHYFQKLLGLYLLELFGDERADKTLATILKQLFDRWYAY